MPDLGSPRHKEVIGSPPDSPLAVQGLTCSPLKTAVPVVLE